MYGNSSNANELMAVIVANGLVSSIISTVLIILAIVGMWKMFRKAGKPGWAAIIPFYQTWVWGSVVFANKKKTIAWLVSEIILAILLCAIVGIALTSAPATSGSMYSSRAMTSSQIPVQMTGGLMIASLLFAIVGIVYTVFQLMALIATSWSFGKRDGFAVGLIFLEPIFLAIIGLSGSIRYVGPGGVPAEGDADDQPSRAVGDAYWQSERVEEQAQPGQPPASQMASGMPPATPQSSGQAQPVLPFSAQLTGEMPPVAVPAMPSFGQPLPDQLPSTQPTGGMPPVMPPNSGPAETAFAHQPAAALAGTAPIAVPTEAMLSWQQDDSQIQRPFAAVGQTAWQPIATHGMAEPATSQEPAAATGELFQPSATPGGFAAPLQPQAQPLDLASDMQRMPAASTQRAFGQQPQQASPLQPSWMPSQEPQIPEMHPGWMLEQVQGITEMQPGWNPGQGLQVAPRRSGWESEQPQQAAQQAQLFPQVQQDAPNGIMPQMPMTQAFPLQAQQTAQMPFVHQSSQVQQPQQAPYPMPFAQPAQQIPPTSPEQMS